MIRLSIIIVASLFTCVILPFFGRELIGPSMLGNTGEALIFWQLRVPRVLLSFFAGGGLALSGLLFQALFRNPLATPYTLGVASGASFGASLAIAFGFSFLSLWSFAGALLAISLVYTLARWQRNFDTGFILLSGVAVGLFFSSFVLLIQFLSRERDALRLMRWLMGGVNVVGMEWAYKVLPFLTIALFMAFFSIGRLNLLSVNDDFAASRGIDVEKSRKFLFLVASLLVAGVVSECGPIGFVGLIIPHISRILLGHDHRYLLPGSFCLGGVFLGLCDLLARSMIQETLLPLGVITALLGGPFFLYLLLSRQRA